MTACIGHHGDDRPLPEPGLLLCAWHRKGLGNDLSHLAALWPLLVEMVTVSNGGQSGGASGKPGSRPPCNLTITDITDPRGTVAAQIGGWARIVVEERRLPAAPADIHAAVRLLALHADWVAAQPWADEAVAEIHDAAMTVRRACHDLPDPPLGFCPDIDPRGETERCGGPLRWHDNTGTVVCGRCGSWWGTDDLPHILRVVEPTRRFPVPRAWVAARYAVNEATLRQWVRRGHVKTYSDEQVELIDVLKRIQEG